MMFRSISPLAAVCMLATTLFVGSARAQTALEDHGTVPVDLELVLAVDVSGSIDFDEAKLQRQGYVSAIIDPAVVRAITSGELGRIAMTYVEWGDPFHQRTIVDWMVIDSQLAAEEFAAKLISAPIEGSRRTSISEVIFYSIAKFRTNEYRSPRKVIDISGDGPNNGGFWITAARDQANSLGIIINGLPILNSRLSAWGYPGIPDLDLYYEDCVIGGPGSFIIVAESLDTFAVAVRRKLLLEIAGVTPPRRPRVHLAQAGKYDCFVGEKQFNQLLSDGNRRPSN